MITLGDLTTNILTRLGDPGSRIWTTDEVSVHVRNAYEQIASDQRMFYDWVYLENLPPFFSMTAPWEASFAEQLPCGFHAGVANFTAEIDREALTDSGRGRYGPAACTSPFEATDGWLSLAGACAAIPATADVPKTLTSLDRVSWDKRGIDGMTPRLMQRVDARYELTKGEVYGFMWAKDGVRTLRKVRVPSAQACTAYVEGSWGLLRDPTDLSTDATLGLPAYPQPFSKTQLWEIAFSAGVVDVGVANVTTLVDDAVLPHLIGPRWFTSPFEWTDGWLAVLGLATPLVPTFFFGVPRVVPSHHPMGYAPFYGAPRRPYLDGTNVRLEHHRFGRPLCAWNDICELPTRYSRYLRDYAQARLLERKGPGQDLTLSEHFESRWQRGLARIAHRLNQVQNERVVVLGGDGQSLMTRPASTETPLAVRNSGELMAIPFERIVQEDINFGFGTVPVSMPGGGSATGTLINLETFTGGRAGPGLGMHCITDYGADPTGQNDSYPAIQTALDKGGFVFCPCGTYKVMTTPIMSVPCRLVGSGPGIQGQTTNNTVIQGGVAGMTVLTINTHAGIVESLQISRTAPDNGPSTGTLGIAVGTVPASPGQGWLYNVFRDVQFYGLSRGIHFINAASWMMDNCYAYVGECVLIEQQSSFDSGDQSIIGCTFFASDQTTSGSSCIRMLSSGGLKVTNCKLLFGQYAINVQDPGSIAPLITNCSMENFTLAGINVGAGEMVDMSIVGNYIDCLGSPSGPGILMNSTLTGCTITGNTFRAGNLSTGVAVIDLQGINTFTVVGNTIQAQGGGVQLGIRIRTGTANGTIGVNNIQGATVARCQVDAGSSGIDVSCQAS